MKRWGMVVAAGALVGCGTVNTVLREDDVTRQNLREVKSFCNAVPRVYSGVVYDFCRLHAEPSMGISGSGPVMFVIVDMGLSGLLDTLVLPYTVYRQNRDGSIEGF